METTASTEHSQWGPACERQGRNRAVPADRGAFSYALVQLGYSPGVATEDDDESEADPSSRVAPPLSALADAAATAASAQLVFASSSAVAAAAEAAQSIAGMSAPLNLANASIL